MTNDAPKTVVIVGDGGVGKTSIVVRYIRDKFSTVYDPTLENNYEAEIKMPEGQVLKVEIADTAGQEEYQALRDQYLATGHVFIVVYSIIQLSTLRMAEQLLEQISVLKERDPFKFVLLGNKCDLQDQRQVTTQEGKAVADKYKGLFLETSAANKINVDEAFQLVGKLILTKEKKDGCCNLL
ncbi:Ras GTPase [Histomonas meleagridis]|uniref:Ras GTPase n=1 Tax=Histomonas meleagridis TaxID=135588 RepID=UPI00355A7684|nr:Ras GTPase [Histomonas meleagridis]KAH0803369.1 Ras GTPase [Histomonas meleagridis]